MLDDIHCVLGVCFVGIAAQELEILMWNVQSPFGNKTCSYISVKSMQSSVGLLMVGHQTTTVAWQSQQDSPFPSNTDDCPVPVSVEVTPSSAIADHPVDQPAGDGNSSSPAHGLQHVFTQTVLLNSDDEDEKVKFDYGAETLLHPSSNLSKSQHTSSHQMGPHGIPGDALVSPLSRCQFGFTRDFVHDAGAHFKI